MRPAGTTAVVTGSFPAVAIAVAIVSGAAGMVGVYLDTAWHRTVGRDSFFIPPHVFIYCGGLGVLGAALTSVARATLGRAEDFGGPILRLRRLRLPLGFAVGRNIDCKTGFAQPLGQESRRFLFVFDNENPHCGECDV